MSIRDDLAAYKKRRPAPRNMMVCTKLQPELRRRFLQIAEDNEMSAFALARFALERLIEDMENAT
jgi:predicted transcriptional regulator